MEHSSCSSMGPFGTMGHTLPGRSPSGSLCLELQRQHVDDGELLTTFEECHGDDGFRFF